MISAPGRPGLRAAWKFSVGIALLAAISSIGITAITGCGTGYTKGFASAISASTNSIRLGETLQLQTATQVTGSADQFWVNGIAGGNALVGTVDANGMYTAPAVLPTPNNVVTITSLAQKFPDDRKGNFQVNLLNPIPVIQSVTPAKLAEGTTTITVQGAKFVPGAQIMWNGNPVQTNFVSGSQLAASIPAAKPGTYSLTVSNPEPGAACAPNLSEVVGPGQVTVSIQTSAGTAVRVSRTLKVTSQVVGEGNSGVTWLVNGSPTGNAQIGTIVGNPDGSVVYTAPAVVPVPSNVVQLTAASNDNPSIVANQNIEVYNPIPVLTSATPSNWSVGPATAVLTGSNFINGAQVLVNGHPASTTFNSGTQLTANFTATQTGELDLQVLNPAPGPATSTDLVAQVSDTQTDPVVTPADASRFLAQATFGATDGDIHHVSLVGYQAWLNEQFNALQTLHEPVVEQAITINNPPCASNDLMCNGILFIRTNTNERYLQQSFWQQTLTGNDQLRQRVKYALSEMMVVSDTNDALSKMPRMAATYYDILGTNAFGNFRKLLEDVTLSPAMGTFLSTLGNDKGDATRDPDENYAREVMQLFTVGLYQLNQDGTQKLDATGTPIPNYSNTDVMGLAKVFTGFSWNAPGPRSEKLWSYWDMYVGPGFGQDMLPMQPFPNHHSTAEKDFLGVTIAASGNSDPAGDLKIALDTLFLHPSLPPFFAKQMIQHLVTSNPSPAYVSRVAGVFIDNGRGVRGDMKAVITAILLDDEARNTAAARTNPQAGKVREALIRYTEWARAFTAQSRTGVFNLNSSESSITGLGEMWFRSPSVFNWFAPGFVPPGTSIEKAGMVAPEMQMTDVSSVVGYLNYMQTAIGGDATQGPDVYSDYSAEIAIAKDADQLLDRLNLLLMAGSMDSTLHVQIAGAVNAIAVPAGDATAVHNALLSRVKTAIYLTMASPAFCAQN